MDIQGRIQRQKWFQTVLRLQIRETGKIYRKQIAAGVLAGAVLGAALCGILYTEPKGYVVQRFYTDGLFDTSVYLESTQDSDYEGYRIMNYKDAETPMQIVDGKAVILETARYYVGSVLIGGFLGYLACAGYSCLKGTEGRRRE